MAAFLLLLCVKIDILFHSVCVFRFCHRFGVCVVVVICCCCCVVWGESTSAQGNIYCSINLSQAMAIVITRHARNHLSLFGGPSKEKLPGKVKKGLLDGYVEFKS